ncbi:hypothetical protein [Labrys neptuniae]
METADRLSVAEIHTDANLEALNAVLAAARIEAARIITIHLLPGIQATVGSPVRDRYRVLYRH